MAKNQTVKQGNDENKKALTFASGIPVYCSYTDIVDIDSLIPNPRNPNTHPKKQIKLLAKIIQNQGWRNSIVVSKRSGFITKGHGRLEAARLLGVGQVPIDRQNYENEATEWADMIADNRIAELAVLEEQTIADLLKDIDINFDVELTGYTPDLATELINKYNAKEIKEDGESVPDAPAPEEAITRPGDLWVLGRHRLLCGDALDLAAVEKLMDGEKADMVFTDPPYNVNYGEKASMLNEYQKGHRNTDSIKNDNMTNDTFLCFLTDAFKNIYTILRPGGAYYVCHSETMGMQFRKAIADAGLLLKQCIIWAKNTLVIGRQDYQWKHEPILYGWKPGAAHTFFGGRKETTVIEDNEHVVFEVHDGYVLIHFSFGIQSMTIKVPEYEIMFAGDDELTTVWRVEKPTRNDKHPTMKPIALGARAMKNSSRENDIVIDFFSGSGSTLIGCEQLNRRCFAMELDPGYCDVIVQRWENFTGEKAKLLK